MAKAKLLRYLIAFLTAICVAAVLSSFTWLGGEMLRAFPLSALPDRGGGLRNMGRPTHL